MILKQLHPLLSKKTTATVLLIPDVKVLTDKKPPLPVLGQAPPSFQENGCQLIEGAYGIKAD